MDRMREQGEAGVNTEIGGLYLEEDTHSINPELQLCVRSSHVMGSKYSFLLFV